MPDRHDERRERDRGLNEREREQADCFASREACPLYFGGVPACGAFCHQQMKLPADRMIPGDCGAAMDDFVVSHAAILYAL
jgi:hypothetical protein